MLENQYWDNNGHLVRGICSDVEEVVAVGKGCCRLFQIADID